MEHGFGAARGFLAALLLLLAAFGAPAVAAETDNPQLSALIDGVDDEGERSADLRIEALEIAVRVHGGIAETSLTARLRNPGQDRLEGRFSLAMPEGSVVTGYALDVGGTMIDGVLVDQIEARRAYEARVRERIDPGLGEVSRGFRFSTRVYPIEAGSARTVRLTFVSPLDPVRGYVLPLSHGQDIGELSIVVEASGVAAAPRLVLPVGGETRWEGQGPYRASFQGAQRRIAGSLTIATTEREAAMLAGRGGSGETFFEIVDQDEGPSARAPRPRSVAILWDRSLSRRDDRLEAEIGMLRDYLERVRPQAIELILFDGGGAERVRLKDAESVSARLRAIVYRGATSLDSFSGKAVAADTCLLFTDGLVTLGRRDSFKPDCVLNVVSSSSDADRPWLGALARARGGAALHLGDANGAQLLDELTRQTVRVAAVRSTAGAPVDFALLDAPAGGWRIVGRMPDQGGVVVRLTGSEAPERVYMPEGGVGSWPGAASLWAADRLAVRAASEEEERDAVIAFARRYSVAGPDISFLVLETPEDYVEARIEPPATLPAELLGRYRELAAADAGAREKELKERFDTLLERWEEQKKWWATRFDIRAKRDDGNGDGDYGGPIPEPVPEPVPVPPPSPEPTPAQPAVPPAQPSQPAQPAQPAPADGVVSSGNSDVTVTGTQLKDLPGVQSSVPLGSVGNDSVVGQPQPPEPEVKAAEWASDRPYLKALKAARPEQWERVLAEQQAVHGTLPAFWFDVSEFYHRGGRRAEALRLLLSALELPTRDSETLGIVAERLVRWGDHDRAVALYERMTAMDRKHPHPRRGLALALAKRAAGKRGEAARADLARAIALLADVALTVDDDDHEGFNLVALTEVNSIIARYRRLGGTDVPLDPRLIANLDLDLRIVLEWKNEEIDVDMWLTEPNGERASYYNDETAIGGRLSDETTDGSGPEQYMLRRAAPGTYSLKAEIYSSDPINPNGTARVIARLIRDFGRSGQREELVEVELSPQKEDEDSDDEDRIPVAKIFIRR
ncbi:MAG TPA: VIT domain-containing protein [Allosphingosinicella sp.]|nr:VIT domain-containing protein [Allosphingosinicella sp.]